MSILDITNELTTDQLELLNSKNGIKALLSGKKVNLKKAMDKTIYENRLKELQKELILLQHWVIDNNKKVIIIFEGRDSAGKGGAIRRITEHINPRFFRTVALGIPTEDERRQWFFQRYANQLPRPGEIVFFDRSWYNRAVVEPVNGFCTQKEYSIFMSHVNDFEKMLIDADTYLIKFYFSITKEEQAARFSEIKKSPLKRWKITPVDEMAQELWDDYTKYKLAMFEKTNTDVAPWTVIDANKKSNARIEVIEKILNKLPYKE